MKNIAIFYACLAVIVGVAGSVGLVIAVQAELIRVVAVIMVGVVLALIGVIFAILAKKE